MTRRALLLLPPAVLVVGCRGLAGTWEGELLCLGRQQTVDGDATVRLVSDRGGEFEGELRSEGTLTTATGRQEMVLAWQLELEKTAPSGRQELDYLVDDCLLYVDGHLEDAACPDAPMQWLWDGGDLVDMQSDDCSLTLTR